MTCCSFPSKRALLLLAAAMAGLLLSSSVASAQEFEIKSVAEKKIDQLPPGPLFWRIDNFPTLAQAQGAAGPTALVAEVAGKVWLFTLGPKDGSSPGGTKVAEVGPVQPISAPEYLLRINSVGGAPGVKTPVHTHPGSETFYADRRAQPEESPWCEPYSGRSVHAGTRPWHADGGLQQRRRRPACFGHVCGGRYQAVLITRDDAVRRFGLEHWGRLIDFE